MQRIIFLNRFFFPDHSATSQILSDLAFELAKSGMYVHVITSQQRYDDPAASLEKTEYVRGVHVQRIETTTFGRKKLLGRAIDYFSFYVSVYAALCRLAQPGDIIVAKTDPPLVSIPAMLVAKSSNCRLINWLQDLYPEVALEFGVPFLRGPVGKGLKLLRNKSLRLADINVVVGRRMASKLAKLEIPSEKIEFIPNWCNDQELLPVTPNDNPLRVSWKLKNKFVVGYSGNLGRAHEFDTVLGAAQRLRDNMDIIFLFIGGGYSFDALMQKVRELQLDKTFRFMPYQDHDNLKYSLCVPDVHLLSLRPEMEGLIVPSKFYGIAAVGRPLLAVAAEDGEFAADLKRFHCGLVIRPGHAEELADAILALAHNPGRCAEMGRQSRAMLDESFMRQQAFARWKHVLALTRKLP